MKKALNIFKLCQMARKKAYPPTKLSIGAGQHIVPVEPESRKFLKDLEGTHMDATAIHRKMRGWVLQHDPDRGMPRLFAVLTRLYELSVLGDTDAMKLFLDRTVGKPTESIAIGIGQFDTMDNKDLLASIVKVSNVVQSPSAVNSRDNEEGL